MTRKSSLFVTGIIAAGILAGWAVYSHVFASGKELEGSGTVEARNIRVGSMVGGRIVDVRVREGDRVEAGQVLVTFDEQQLRAALDEARANLEKMQKGSRPEDIAEARGGAAQARADYEAARAEIERTRADTIHAERNFKRVSDLANADVFSKQQRDDAEATWKMAVATQHNAEQKLVSAKAHSEQAEATLLKTERGNRREDIDYAEGQLRDAEARYRERQVVAPSAATVEVLDVRPGDLIAPNTAIATLLERDQIYVRIYIPETKIGQVHAGQQAEVRVDSFPKEVFQGEVEQINQKAEFLPRNVETKEERVHQVFGIKLRIHDPSSRIRAGMAADVKLKP